MFFRLAADTTLILHLAFILFVIAGGLLWIRWRWAPLLHLPAAAWGAYVELAGAHCPLTLLEKHFRLLAGQSGYPQSFVEHYLLPVIYPAGLTRDIQFVLGGVVLLSNLLIYAWLIRRRRQAAS
jgi:hypothetical protein